MPENAENAETAGNAEHAGHVSSLASYVGTWAALMVLTAVTVWVGYRDFGIANDVVALAIAVVKALLVILLFMHVKESGKLTRLTVAAGFFWLAILIGITLTDYLSRPAVERLRGVPDSSRLEQPHAAGAPASRP